MEVNCNSIITKVLLTVKELRNIYFVFIFISCINKVMSKAIHARHIGFLSCYDPPSELVHCRSLTEKKEGKGKGKKQNNLGIDIRGVLSTLQLSRAGEHKCDGFTLLLTHCVHPSPRNLLLQRSVSRP